REQVQPDDWAAMLRQFGLSEAQLTRDLPEQHLAAWGARSSVAVIDLLPRMQVASQTQRLYFRTDRHWNAAGHALAAQIIAEGLTALGVLR
ncbi:MAG TPA: hypothetical protein VM536_08390, partial [Chloroflexia bacterium]|nr:hypothetical protein [Chloroflexia bacterium]